MLSGEECVQILFLYFKIRPVYQLQVNTIYHFKSECFSAYQTVRADVWHYTATVCSVDLLSRHWLLYKLQLIAMDISFILHHPPQNNMNVCCSASLYPGCVSQSVCGPFELQNHVKKNRMYIISKLFILCEHV